MRRAPFAVVTGGGTGGHVTPALAVAEALVAAGHDPREILVVGGRRGIERRLVPAAGFELVALPGRGIRRSFTIENLGSLAGLAAAAAAASYLAATRRPRVVVTLGGYAGFAYAAAALAFRIPLVVVTVDAVPGAVNRLVGRFAAANAVVAEGTGLPRETLTGAPLRQMALSVRRSEENSERVFSRLSIDRSRHLVVVSGGSLGAGSINEATLQLASAWSQRRDIAIYQLAGERNLSEVAEKARAAGLMDLGSDGLSYRLADFDEELSSVLAAAEAAVSRAGALSVAELTLLGVPAVLVPLPGSPGAHQEKNAWSLAEKGAAVVVPDAELSGARLSDALSSCIEEPSRGKMAAAALSLGRRDGARVVAELAIGLARGGE